MLLGELINEVHADFKAAPLAFGHGTDNAWDEAVYLVLSVTGEQDNNEALANSVSTDHVAEIRRIAAQRIEQRVPLAYLLGRCVYMGLEFIVEPGLIVPRSPLGILICEQARPWLRHPPAHILDLCAGTGCLGLLAAVHFPEAEVLLLDNDPRACSVAQRNIAQLDAQFPGLAARTRVEQADATNLPQMAPFDLILCNPPYVNAVDMQSLPKEYAAEPSHGLGAGEDGLSVILPVLEQLPSLLAANGIFAGEVGASAAALVRQRQDLPLIWLEMPDGGEGVFVLEASALSSHTAGLST